MGSVGPAAGPADDASLRGVTLDFLLEFAWTHDAWEMPTRDVVKLLIAPATANAAAPGQPYTALLPPSALGLPTHFISHAWGNPFGLLVAAARKFLSAARDQKPFLWLDIFAVTQHPGEHQAHDLTRLEATIARPECTTLVVLDEAGGPLSRCWCIFEFFATLLHAERHGKLQVRAGSLAPGGAGEFIPCTDPGRLAALAEGVNALDAVASVPADKAMILGRLHELGIVGSRTGVHELNRKLARAVRHGW